MSTEEPGACKECGRRGRYQRYGLWFCERHIGLAEHHRDREARDSNRCPHGVMWGDRTDLEGRSEMLCPQCEQARSGEDQ